MGGKVYFIATGEGSVPWVKIGFTAGCVFQRCRLLQTGCPLSLNVLAFAHGTRADEQSLHQRFAAFRGYGEWFVMEGFLQAYIVDLMRSAPPMQIAPTLWTEVYRNEEAGR